MNVKTSVYRTSVKLIHFAECNKMGCEALYEREIFVDSKMALQPLYTKWNQESHI